jgi:Helix-turn-helix domain
LVVAFNSISPAAARQLLGGVSAADEDTLLSDFVEAGLIRAYARVVETFAADGGRSEVRDAQIQRDLWRRIVAEGKVTQFLARSSIKLDGDGLVGGRPAVTITGVRFNETNVRDVAAQHGAATPATPKQLPPKAPPAAHRSTQKPVDAPPLIELVPSPGPENLPARGEPALRPRATLPAGNVMVSIADTMDILDVSRGTVGNMIKRGDLDAKKIGSRTLIPAESNGPSWSRFDGKVPRIGAPHLSPIR